MSARVVSFYIYEVEVPGYAELSQVCKNSRVQKIGGPVYVEGYYKYVGRCRDCWHVEMIKKDASFMEFEIKDEKNIGRILNQVCGE